jgi:phosphatidylserine/phosphatidylglycerophosphate/cardiolipin synthase-like enzyme
MSQTDVFVAVTGLAWMGSGIGAIESAIERLFREAKSEITITAYAIGSSTDLLFEWLETALNRGVRINMVVNRLETQPDMVVSYLHRLVESFPHFFLYRFPSDEEVDLHAKVIVVDRRIALVGSSNISRRGLLYNHELSILIRNSAAEDIARAVDLLIASKYVSPVH